MPGQTNFQTISCTYNHPGSGRDSQCWIAGVLHSALKAQNYTEGWQVPTGFVAISHLCQKSCGKAWHSPNQPPEPVSAPWAVPSSASSEDVSICVAACSDKLTGKLLPLSVYVVEITFLLRDICKDLFPNTPQVQIPPAYNLMHII